MVFRMSSYKLHVSFPSSMSIGLVQYNPEPWHGYMSQIEEGVLDLFTECAVAHPIYVVSLEE